MAESADQRRRKASLAAMASPKGFGPARAGAELFLVAPDFEAEGGELAFELFGDREIGSRVT
jgi:hypothetical protein